MGVMPRKLGVNDPLVKQIRNGDIVERLIDRGDGYFAWLQRKSGLDGPLSSLLAETEFVNSCGNDEILMEKAKEELRRRYAEEVLEDDCVSDKEIETVNKSVRGPVCLFEVILCLAISINEMFEEERIYLIRSGAMDRNEKKWPGSTSKDNGELYDWIAGRFRFLDGLHGRK